MLLLAARPTSLWVLLLAAHRLVLLLVARWRQRSKGEECAEHRRQRTGGVYGDLSHGPTSGQTPHWVTPPRRGCGKGQGRP